MNGIPLPRFAGLFALGLALVAVACSETPELDPRKITIEGWVRATIPGTEQSAAFLRLHNDTDTPLTLVAVESSLVENISIHETREHQGLMQMRPVLRVEIPAGTTVEFMPGGLHLMLEDLADPLQPGTRVPISLHFENGMRSDVEFPVREVTAQ